MIIFKWSSKTDQSKQMLVKDRYIGDKTVKNGKGIINTKFRMTMVMGEGEALNEGI